MAHKGERHSYQKVASVTPTHSHVGTRTTYGVVRLVCGHAYSAVVGSESRAVAHHRLRCPQCAGGPALHLTPEYFEVET